MKKTFFFKALLVVWSGLMLLPCAPAASAEVPASWEEKLAAWDVEAIWPEVEEAVAGDPENGKLLEKASQIAFYRGDYEESLKLMQRAMAAGKEEEEGRRGFGLFIEETINVLAPYKRYESPHFIVRLEESQDGFLADYLLAALEKTESVMAGNYGYRPGEKVRIELLPDTKSFYRTSSLSVRDIEVTGAVGLAKFNKLQFLSPRALVQGYRWLDAISHEYMHYLIVKLTANKAPIWFHEGLAKYEETRWREGPDYLSSINRTLLARAVAEDALIGFEKMEPSLLHLETPQEVQLAYAQAASAIEFIIHRNGHDGLRKVMERMAQSEERGASEAIQAVLGLSFSEFEEEWKKFLIAKELQPVPGVTVHSYKVKEGLADEERMELKEIKSLVARNRTRLGDKLKERGRLGAAVLEYRRALKEAGDSIAVMNRLSAALISLGRDEEARKVLQRILILDADRAAPYTQLGQLALKRKDFQEAKEAFTESLQINPFNPLVHDGLAEAYGALGDSLESEKERTIARALRR